MSVSTTHPDMTIMYEQDNYIAVAPTMYRKVPEYGVCVPTALACAYNLSFNEVLSMLRKTDPLACTRTQGGTTQYATVLALEELGAKITLPVEKPLRVKQLRKSMSTYLIYVYLPVFSDNGELHMEDHFTLLHKGIEYGTANSEKAMVCWYAEIPNNHMDSLFIQKGGVASIKDKITKILRLLF